MTVDSTLIFEMLQPETELAVLCREVLDLAEQEPRILTLIASDQENKAKQRKKLRLLDKRWEDKQRTPFPEFGPCEDVEINIEDLSII